MKKIIILYLLCLSGLAYGQKSQVYVQNLKSSDQDLFQKNLYSADRVMELRNQLDLTEAQATKIKKIHSENAGKFSTMKWDLDDETVKLKTLLNASKIDETAVQKQMDKVLSLENSLKKQQLSTMVSIKNELSVEQQEILISRSSYDLQGKGSVEGLRITSLAPESVNRLKGSNIKVATGSSPKLATSVNGSANPRVLVQVAGTSTGQNSSPLYYLDTHDGMQEMTDFSKINPNDIESINVLKDKAAVEKFGEKGKNGVIIIKLKDDSKK